MAQRKRGKWRVTYGAYARLWETGPMSKWEAKQYYSMARINCMLGHWDWVRMVRVKEEYTEGKMKPVVSPDLLRAAYAPLARQSSGLTMVPETGVPIAT